MLWILWLVIMLMVPVTTGAIVWWQMRDSSPESAMPELTLEGAAAPAPRVLSQ